MLEVISGQEKSELKLWRIFSREILKRQPCELSYTSLLNITHSFEKAKILAFLCDVAYSIILMKKRIRKINILRIEHGRIKYNSSWLELASSSSIWSYLWPAEFLRILNFSKKMREPSKNADNFSGRDFVEIEWGEMLEIDNWLSEARLYRMLWNLKTSKLKKNLFGSLARGGAFLSCEISVKGKIFGKSSNYSMFFSLNRRKFRRELFFHKKFRS